MDAISQPNCRSILTDAVEFWQNDDVTGDLGPADTRTIYVGGAWFDEEVLFTALNAVRIGYDTRLLLDVSIARSWCDRTPALDRMLQHGVLMTTIRQVVVEWSIAAHDREIGRHLRNILR